MNKSATYIGTNLPIGPITTVQVRIHIGLHSEVTGSTQNLTVITRIYSEPLSMESGSGSGETGAAPVSTDMLCKTSGTNKSGLTVLILRHSLFS